MLLSGAIPGTWKVLLTADEKISVLQNQRNRRTIRGGKVNVSQIFRRSAFPRRIGCDGGLWDQVSLGTTSGDARTSFADQSVNFPAQLSTTAVDRGYISVLPNQNECRNATNTVSPRH